MATDPPADPPPFGELLRRLRVAAGLTQEALAERAGLSARGLSDLERGVHAAPRQDTLDLLVAALVVDPAERAALVTAARRSAATTSRPRVPSAGFQPIGAPRFPGAKLPVLLDPLIGREHEVTAVVSLFHDPSVRFVTLTGPGGVGKTRLALQVAANLAGAFPGGVGFVPLAAIREATLVLPTIAQALGVRDAPNRPPEETLAVALRDQRVLLVLDNLEQVLDAASAVARLLAACPELHILVTSRVALRLTGEQRFLVPPLATTDLASDHREETLPDNPAFRLFVRRARQVRADFALTPEAAAASAAICARLDGLPLAIELAAARVTVLPPTTLLARLERGLPVLSGGARDQPARLQTMRDAIAWSYDLLPAGVQSVFRQVAVFEGGFTFEAAMAVCDADDTPEDEFLDAIAGLVEANLVRSEDGFAGNPRLSLLETIREFGLERLGESGEDGVVQGRHAAFYAGLAVEAEPVFQDELPEHATWLVRLDAEHPNLRAALDWLLRGGDPELGLRMAAALFWFWHLRSHLGEGRSWLARALEAAPLAPAIDRAKALFGVCLLTLYRGEEERALALGEESLARFREIGDRAGTGRALQLLGIVMEDRGDYDRATALFEEALALHEKDHDRPWTAHALRHLALVTYGRGDLGGAAALVEEALALYRELGQRWGITVSLIYLGVIACERRDVRRAAAAYAEALDLARELGSRQVIARGLVGVATLAAFHGLPDLAARLFGAADALCGVLGYRFALPERAQYDRARAAARSVLGDEGFTTAWEAGRDVPVEEAAAEARTVAALVTPTPASAT